MNHRNGIHHQNVHDDDGADRWRAHANAALIGAVLYANALHDNDVCCNIPLFYR